MDRERAGAGTGGLGTVRAVRAVAIVAAVVLAVVLAPVVMVVRPSIARADGAWGTIDGGVPEAIVIVSAEGQLASWSSAAAGGPRWTCGYYRVVAPVHSVLDPSPVVDWSTRVSPQRDESYMLACFDQDGERVRTRYVQFDPGDPFSGIGASERALDEARKRLEIPDPDPVINPPREQLVGLPTWLWLDRPWERISAVASIGDVWAAVSAHPVQSHWLFSDGSELWCDRGEVYDIWRSPREQSSGCTHTFRHSSSMRADGVEWIAVVVTWRVEWYASDIGGQPLGTVDRATAFPVRVIEAQAMIR